MAVGVFLERHGQSYYNNNVPPVLGYCQTPRTTRTYDYSEEVVWKADRTEFDQTEFSKLGLTKYNADHDWACGINYSISGYDDLQTYIRAPNFVPTNLTILSQNSTSITIAWSAVNITEADGYVVYINHLYSDKHSAVITNNTRQYTLWYRQELPLYGYNITVRAHQDLLGPPSEPIVIPTTNLSLTSLECINANFKIIVIGLTTPHSLPQEGLSYHVRYSRCESASLEGSRTTVEKTVIIHDLSPHTCYEFTIRSKFAKLTSSEEHTVQCNTLPNQNQHEISIGVLTTLTIAGIISAFALLVTVVVLVVKRMQNQDHPCTTHCLQKTQRRLCDMRTNITYSSEEGYVNDDYPTGNPYNEDDDQHVPYEIVQN